MLQVTAGVAVQYLGYTPGLFIVGLFAILILWMYANFLITGLLLIVGGMMLLLLLGFLDMFSFSDHKRREDMPIVYPSFVFYTDCQNCEAHRKITILRVFAPKPCWITYEIRSCWDQIGILILAIGSNDPWRALTRWAETPPFPCGTPMPLLLCADFAIPFHHPVWLPLSSSLHLVANPSSRF